MTSTPAAVTANCSKEVLEQVKEGEVSHWFRMPGLYQLLLVFVAYKKKKETLDDCLV